MTCGRFIAAAAVAASVALPLAAQPVGPPAPLPKVIPDNRCPTNPAPAQDGEEIVVCGQGNPDNSPYRIPRELRNRDLPEDRNVSWDTRVRDMEAMERFSSQNVGPSGMSQVSRQRDCEYRAARQELAGRRPDCGRGRRPGE